MRGWFSFWPYERLSTSRDVDLAGQVLRFPKAGRQARRPDPPATPETPSLTIRSRHGQQRLIRSLVCKGISIYPSFLLAACIYSTMTRRHHLDLDPMLDQSTRFDPSVNPDLSPYVLTRSKPKNQISKWMLLPTTSPSPVKTLSPIICLVFLYLGKVHISLNC
jgi:hypothetical protein